MSFRPLQPASVLWTWQGASLDALTGILRDLRRSIPTTSPRHEKVAAVLHQAEATQWWEAQRRGLIREAA